MSDAIVLPILQQLVTRTIEQLVALDAYHDTSSKATASSSSIVHGDSQRLFGDLLTRHVTPSSWPYTIPACVARVSYTCINKDIMTIVQPLVHQQYVHGACGYYAIVNAMTILRTCIDRYDGDATRALCHHSFSRY